MGGLNSDVWVVSTQMYEWSQVRCVGGLNSDMWVVSTETFGWSLSSQVYWSAVCCRPRHVITTLEAIVNEARHIPAYLPNVNALEEAMHRAHEWTCKVDGVQVGHLIGGQVDR